MGPWTRARGRRAGCARGTTNASTDGGSIAMSSFGSRSGNGVSHVILSFIFDSDQRQRIEVAGLGARGGRNAAVRANDVYLAALPAPASPAWPQESARRRQALNHRRRLALESSTASSEVSTSGSGIPKRPPSTSSPSSSASATPSRCRRQPHRARAYLGPVQELALGLMV